MPGGPRADASGLEPVEPGENESVAERRLHQLHESVRVVQPVVGDNPHRMQDTGGYCGVKDWAGPADIGAKATDKHRWTQAERKCRSAIVICVHLWFHSGSWAGRQRWLTALEYCWYYDRDAIRSRTAEAYFSTAAQAGGAEVTASVLAFVLLLAQPAAGDSVEAVKFAGSRSFKAQELRQVVAAQPGQLLIQGRLDNDVRLLARFYRERGFREVLVNGQVRRGKRQWVVTYFIREGPRARVGQIVLTGYRAFDVSRLLKILPARAGQHYSRGLLSRGMEALRQFYLNTGYPFVKVAGSSDFDDGLATLTIDIDEGPRCRIGRVLVRGNRTVKTGTVLRAAEVAPGELFRQDRLHAARSRLYGTRLFQRVLFYVNPDSTADSLVLVRFDVVEQPHRVFSFGGGFETPPFRLLLSVGWEHVNLFNAGHNLATDVEYSPDFSGDYRVSLDATYRIPYLVLTRVDLFTHPFFHWEEIDSTRHREYGVETGLSRSLRPELSVGLSNRIRLVADTSSGITNGFVLNAQYDTRDDIFDPSHGVYLWPVAEVAGGILIGDNDFFRLTGEARWFGSLGRGFVLALRGMAGRAFPYGRTDRMPYYEAFKLGGRNSLRGYDDRSLGPDSTGPDSTGGERFGPMVLNASLELRTPYAFGWVGLVGFLDGGEVVDPQAGFGVEQFEYSAGVGVRVRTPIGPVRVDWGKRLKDPEPGDVGKFYLGLLHAF